MRSGGTGNHRVPPAFLTMEYRRMRMLEHCFSRRHWAIMAAWAAVASVALLATGCANPGGMARSDSIQTRLSSLGPAQVIILGEQHYAREHQQLETLAVQQLAQHNQLGALVLEMAEQGTSTASLRWFASEVEIQQALAWNDQAWSWFDYGPAVVAAVRAGVPVLGGNLPRARLAEAMADASLDTLLNAKALGTLQDAVREGHCSKLPESQIAPMARVQVARDRTMAQTAAQAIRIGRTVLIITGAAHADRRFGIANHLPPKTMVRTVKLWATDTSPSVTPMVPGYDDLWRTYPVAPQDYCARIKAQP